MSDGEDDSDKPAPTMNHKTVDATQDHVLIVNDDASPTSTTNMSTTPAIPCAPRATSFFVPDTLVVDHATHTVSHFPPALRMASVSCG